MLPGPATIRPPGPPTVPLNVLVLNTCTKFVPKRVAFPVKVRLLAAVVTLVLAPVRLLAAVIVGVPTPTRELMKAMVKKLGPAVVTAVATTALGRPVLAAGEEVVSSALRAAWMLAASVTGLALQVM